MLRGKSANNNTFKITVDTEPDGTLFFRSLASTTKSARLRAFRRMEWLKEIVSFLQEYIKFPELKMFEPKVPTDPTEITFDRIEQLAIEAREFWSLKFGPISNVTAFLETIGFVVSRHELESEKLDGFSQWSTGCRPFVIVAEDKRSCVRTRFDLCHELGHMVLHRHVDQKHLNTKATFSLMEQQAHRFAGAFLLPEDSYLSEMRSHSLDEMLARKSRWKVSIASMVVRSAQLEAISAEAESRMFANIGRRKWRKREPLDDIIPCESPKFLVRCFNMLFDKEIVVPSSLPSILGLGPHDIESLVGLPAGFIKNADLSQNKPELLDTHILKFPQVNRSDLG